MSRIIHIGIDREGLSPYQQEVQSLLSINDQFGAAVKAELREKLLARGGDQDYLAQQARNTRKETGNDKLIVRASLEFSNVCRQKCSFCGMTALNKDLERYRMDADQMEQVISDVADLGVRYLHLASGEDWATKAGVLAMPIKAATAKDMEVTLATSHRKITDYQVWKDAGASRYILKVETTNPSLFKEARTGTHLPTRIGHLLHLRKIGYQIGSGIICGLPNQTVDDLVNDLLFLKELNPDMASVSRFLPNEKSNFSGESEGNHDLTLNFISLLRTELACSDLRIPAGTTLGRRQEDAINHGANVVSLHVTPDEYADLYSADRIIERHMTKIEAIKALSRNTEVPLQFQLK